MTLREIFNKIVDFDLTHITDILIYGVIIIGVFIWLPYLSYVGIKQYSEEYKTYSLWKKIYLALGLFILTGAWVLAIYLYLAT